MSLVASNESKGGGVTQEALAPSNYMARVVQVLDLGIQAQRPFKGEAKPDVHQILVTYELGTEFLKDEDGNDVEDKPRWITEVFPLYSLGSDRAKSTKRYLALDPNKESGGDWSQMVGKPCMVAVTEYLKNDGSKGNGVGSVSGAPKGIPVPELVNEGRWFDMDNPDMEVFNTLPDWIKTKMTEECKNFQGSGLDHALNGGASPTPPHGSTDSPNSEGEEEYDNDIPV
jgi:hypothetical protein